MSFSYGLIGEKLCHSFSPAIHSRFGNSQYALCPIAPEKLDNFMKNPAFLGINVTIPYKKSVIPYCCHLSDGARKIGSVNTIINKNGELFGYNTDYDGFLYMARRAGVDFCGKHVLILGSGGTSLTAAAVAKDEGAASVKIVSRGGVVNYDNVYEQKNAEIIINTTPVGMFPQIETRPIDLCRFPCLCGSIDVIYNPLRTKFLQQSAALGIPCTCGLPMLVKQAACAHQLFFNVVLSEQSVENAISAMERKFSNIVLVGMPGSGKTTIGKAVAEALSRPFIDTDELVTERANMDIKQIFAQKGEGYFREQEALVIANISQRGGCVIATGGGAVLSAENRGFLSQNGYIIFLKRDLEKLCRKNRPLSSDLAAVRALYAARAPIYEAFSDLQLETQDDVNIGIQKIIQLFGGDL